MEGYFEYAQGTAFGVVNRDDFQEHIHRHFQRATTDDGDAASYALRNAVYAVGCRMMCVHGCQDFSQTQEQALKLFFNAFSRFPDLLFMPSGLRAVQSLVVMVQSSCNDPAVILLWLMNRVDFVCRAPRQPFHRIYALWGRCPSRSVKGSTQAARSSMALT